MLGLGIIHCKEIHFLLMTSMRNPSTFELGPPLRNFYFFAERLDSVML